MNTDIDLRPLEKILLSIDDSEKLFNGNLKSGFLIPLLQEIQEEYGYLPQGVLEHIGRKCGISLSRIFGVITFYEQFYLTPRGKYTIKCCRGTACHVGDGKKIADSISDILKISEGGTTTDGLFTFETVACLGTCFLAPVVMIDDQYFGLMTSKKIGDIIDKYRKGKL